MNYKSGERVGEKVGMVVMFAVFSTVLYFVLKFTEKLPPTWTYFHVMSIALSIVLVGVLLKLVLR